MKVVDIKNLNLYMIFLKKTLYYTLEVNNYDLSYLLVSKDEYTKLMAMWPMVLLPTTYR